jgi:hypothetical protein
METQMGKAKIFGLSGATVTTLVGVATITIESVDFEVQTDDEELKGQDGEVETMISSNRRYSFACQFQPNGATRAAAIASATNIIPLSIDKVTTSGFSVDTLNGTWNALSGTGAKFKLDGTVVMNLKLIAHLANRGTAGGQLQGGAIVG